MEWGQNGQTIASPTFIKVCPLHIHCERWSLKKCAVEDHLWQALNNAPAASAFELRVTEHNPWDFMFLLVFGMLHLHLTVWFFFLMSKPVNVLSFAKWFSVLVTRKQYYGVFLLFLKGLTWHLQHTHKTAIEVHMKATPCGSCQKMLLAFLIFYAFCGIIKLSDFSRAFESLRVMKLLFKDTKILKNSKFWSKH